MIVDEAQDLTPMQLRMVARRAGGSFTLLGDIAQATGPVPYDRWPELLPYLEGGGRRRGRGAAPRLPRAARDHGARAAAAGADRARGRAAGRLPRRGRAAARLVEADPPLAAAFEEAARLAGEEGLLAVIAPASLRGEGESALFDDSRIAVLTPREAKGMEFDHVIVVEPAQIVEEAVEGQGLRELYVALTRPTTTLVLVHARPLPPELGL